MATTDRPENPLDRWPLAQWTLDANGDGRFTTDDAFAILAALFFLPGDLVLFAISRYAAPLARWLDVGAGDYRGVTSGVLSACAWLAAFTVVSIAYHYLLDVDRRVTGATRQLVGTATLRMRIAHALLRQRWRAWLAARRPAKPVEPVREVELSATELRVLQVLAGLAAGYTLSISEVAQALRARTHDTQKLLYGLNELGLLNRALGGIDDETSYTWGAAGKALLAARRRMPRPTHG